MATLESPDDSPLTENAPAQTEMSRILPCGIRRIRTLLRNVVVLRDVQGLPMPDVAERMGISVTAAKSRLKKHIGPVAVAPAKA